MPSVFAHASQRRSNPLYVAVLAVTAFVPLLAHASDTTEPGHANDFFGEALALDGDRLAVGIPGANAGGFNAGRVHVYVHEDGEWQLEAQLHNPGDEPARGYFGRAVALAGDTLVVGAAIENGYAQMVDEERGAVHVYARERGRWRLRASLGDPDVDSDSFGEIVALVGDTLAVASDWRVRDRTALPPQASVYRRHGDSWRAEASLELPAGSIADLALGDGTLLVSSSDGLVAYRRDGDAWRGDPSLTLPDSWVRGLVVDGETAAVLHRDIGEERLSIYRDRDGAWAPETELAIAEPPEAHALRGDWAAFAVSGFDESFGARLNVALWQREGGAWSHVADIAAPSDLPGPSPVFDATLAVNPQWVAVGFPRAGDEHDSQSGLVVVYANRDDRPEVARLSPHDELAGCGCRTGTGPVGLFAGLFALGRRRRRR